MAIAKIYDDVSVVIGDANPHLCEAIQVTLEEEGLTSVETCSSAVDLIAAIEEKVVDLIVIDHSLAGAESADLIQRIRRNALGLNPFASVIATVNPDAAPEMARALADAGADEVVEKPLMVDELFSRISKLTRERQPFIVTARYIGPSRRRMERLDERPIVRRQVPNTLRSRMVDRETPEAIERIVGEAAARLSNDRLDATAEEIDFLVGRIAAQCDAGGTLTEWQAMLQRLIGVSDAWRSDHDGPSRDVIHNLGGMLIGLAKRILDTSAGQRVVEVDLLVQLSQAVRATIRLDRRDASSFEEIARIVSRFTEHE